MKLIPSPLFVPSLSSLDTNCVVEILKRVCALIPGRPVFFGPFRDLLAVVPRMDYSEIYLAVISLSKQGKHKECIQLLTKALSADAGKLKPSGDVFKLHRLLSMTYMSMKSWDNALKAAKMATQLCPDDFVSWTCLASVQIMQHHSTEALQSYQTAFDLSCREQTSSELAVEIENGKSLLRRIGIRLGAQVVHDLIPKDVFLHILHHLGDDYAEHYELLEWIKPVCKIWAVRASEAQSRLLELSATVLALPRLPGIIQAMNNVLDHQYKEFIGTIKSESQMIVPDSDVSEYAKHCAKLIPEPETITRDSFSPHTSKRWKQHCLWAADINSKYDQLISARDVDGAPIAADPDRDPSFWMVCSAIARWSLGIGHQSEPVGTDFFTLIKAPTSQEMMQSALCPEFIPGDENIPIGASKSGGFADLPRIWDDLMPYQGPIPRLICQINLAEIRGKKNISSKLPPKGIIYVLSYSTSIGEMAEAFIRIYTGPCENLAEELVRVAPKGDDEENYGAPVEPEQDSDMGLFRYQSQQGNANNESFFFKTRLCFFSNGVWAFPPCRLQFEELLGLPYLENHHVGATLTDEHLRKLKNVTRQLSTLPFLHRMFGYSTPLQRTYELHYQRDCCLQYFMRLLGSMSPEKLEAATGLPPLPVTGTRFNYREHRSCNPGLLRICKMIPLLEVESDDACSLMFGDSGLMHAFISSDALRRWRFTGAIEAEESELLKVDFQWC